VVPYNPYLCAKYDAHINVEICSSVKAVKYIYKYIFKGHDRALVEVRSGRTVRAAAEPQQGGQAAEERDEIKHYMNCRYVSACEAAWRLFSFNLHAERPNVVRLWVHLPGQQMATYNPAQRSLEDIAAEPPPTILMAGMEFNKELAADDPLRAVLYPDLPTVAWWDKRSKSWIERVRQFTRPPVGRMYFVPPSDQERYCLRTLLHHVPGATCYEDIRTTYDEDGNRTVHDTFKAACEARGLLQNDGEWVSCLSEAASVS
jgi:hypothetical protein